MHKNKMAAIASLYRQHMRTENANRLADHENLCMPGFKHLTEISKNDLLKLIKPKGSNCLLALQSIIAMNSYSEKQTV